MDDVGRLIDAGADVMPEMGLARGARRVLGSVPNTVSHRAPCDVLVVRTP